MATINKFYPSQSKMGIAIWVIFSIGLIYALYESAVKNQLSWLTFIGLVIFYCLITRAIFSYKTDYVKLSSHDDGCVEVKQLVLFRSEKIVHEGLSNVIGIEIYNESGDVCKYLKFSDGYKLPLPDDHDDKLEESIIKWFRKNYNEELQIELHGFRRVNWKAISWKKINWKKIIKKER